MKEQMRIELHNETEYTERISFQDIWTHASRLKYAGCRVAAITDRNSVDGIHMAEHDFMRRGIQPIYGVRSAASMLMTAMMWYCSRQI